MYFVRAAHHEARRPRPRCARDSLSPSALISSRMAHGSVLGSWLGATGSSTRSESVASKEEWARLAAVGHRSSEAYELASSLSSEKVMRRSTRAGSCNSTSGACSAAPWVRRRSWGRRSCAWSSAAAPRAHRRSSGGGRVRRPGTRALRRAERAAAAAARPTGLLQRARARTLAVRATELERERGWRPVGPGRGEEAAGRRRRALVLGAACK